MTEQNDGLKPGNDTSSRSNLTIGELFARLSDQISTLFKGEIELAKVEAISKVSKLGKGGALFAVAGVLAIYLLTFLLHTCAWAIANAIGSITLGYLITSGILLVLIIVLALIGYVFIKKSKQHNIDPATGLKETVEAAKKGFQQ